MTLVFREQQLQGLNTLGLPAIAPLAVLADEQGLPGLCTALHTGPVFVLGGGSNIVVSEQPRQRLVQVRLRGISLWGETTRHWIIEAAAGEPWHEFVVHTLAQGWPGLENLALIPGTVGAAPVQNIGAYGLELDQRLHSLVAWDLHAGQAHELLPHECGFAYRNSMFRRSEPGRWLITRVRFALPKLWRPVLEYPELRRRLQLAESDPGLHVSALQIFDAVCRIRQEKLPDPAVLANAGSFFKNPVLEAAQASRLRDRHPGLPVHEQPDGRTKLAAAWLIQQAGWKGRRLGPAGMHGRQALVLVNHGGATASDVQRLAGAVRDDVQAMFGLVLEQEPVPLC